MMTVFSELKIGLKYIYDYLCQLHNQSKSSILINTNKVHFAKELQFYLNYDIQFIGSSLNTVVLEL